MKNLKKFGNFTSLNEEDEYNEFAPETVKPQIEKMFKFNIETTSVVIRESNWEELSVDISMSNGDELKFDSYYESHPVPIKKEDDNSYDRLTINGKDFPLNEEESGQSIAGAEAAYSRYLKQK